MSPRRMQGELGTGIFVAAVAAAVVALGIYAVANSDGEDSGADYEAVCVDHAGTRVDDNKCPDTSAVSTSDTFDSSAAYGTAYVPTSSSSVVVIPAVGQRMPSGSYSFRTPSSTPSGGGSSKPAVVEKAPATGGAVQRGGFGVKSGASGGGGTAKGGTSSGS